MRAKKVERGFWLNATPLEKAYKLIELNNFQPEGARTTLLHPCMLSGKQIAHRVPYYGAQKKNCLYVALAEEVWALVPSARPKAVATEPTFVTGSMPDAISIELKTLVQAETNGLLMQILEELKHQSAQIAVLSDGIDKLVKVNELPDLEATNMQPGRSFLAADNAHQKALVLG